MDDIIQVMRKAKVSDKLFFEISPVYIEAKRYHFDAQEQLHVYSIPYPHDADLFRIQAVELVNVTSQLHLEEGQLRICEEIIPFTFCQLWSKPSFVTEFTLQQPIPFDVLYKEPLVSHNGYTHYNGDNTLEVHLKHLLPMEQVRLKIEPLFWRSGEERSKRCDKHEIPSKRIHTHRLGRADLQECEDHHRYTTTFGHFPALVAEIIIHADCRLPIDKCKLFVNEKYYPLFLHLDSNTKGQNHSNRHLDSETVMHHVFRDISWTNTNTTESNHCALRRDWNQEPLQIRLETPILTHGIPITLYFVTADMHLYTRGYHTGFQSHYQFLKCCKHLNVWPAELLPIASKVSV